MPDNNFWRDHQIITVLTFCAGSVAALWGGIEILLRIDPFFAVCFKFFLWFGVAVASAATTGLALYRFGTPRWVLRMTAAAPRFFVGGVTILGSLIAGGSMLLGAGRTCSDQPPVLDGQTFALVCIGSAIAMALLTGGIQHRNNGRLPDLYAPALLVPLLIVGFGGYGISQGRGRDIRAADIAQEQLNEMGLRFEPDSMGMAIYMLSHRSIELFRRANFEQGDILGALGNKAPFRDDLPLVDSLFERIGEDDALSCWDSDERACRSLKTFFEILEPEGEGKFCEAALRPFDIRPPFQDSAPARPLFVHAIEGGHASAAVAMLEKCPGGEPALAAIAQRSVGGAVSADASGGNFFDRRADRLSLALATLASVNPHLAIAGAEDLNQRDREALYTALCERGIDFPNLLGLTPPEFVGAWIGGDGDQCVARPRERDEAVQTPPDLGGALEVRFGDQDCHIRTFDVTRLAEPATWGAQDVVGQEEDEIGLSQARRWLEDLMPLQREAVGGAAALEGRLNVWTSPVRFTDPGGARYEGVLQQAFDDDVARLRLIVDESAADGPRRLGVYGWRDWEDSDAFTATSEIRRIREAERRRYALRAAPYSDTSAPLVLQEEEKLNPFEAEIGADRVSTAVVSFQKDAGLGVQAGDVGGQACLQLSPRGGDGSRPAYTTRLDLIEGDRLVTRRFDKGDYDVRLVMLDPLAAPPQIELWAEDVLECVATGADKIAATVLAPGKDAPGFEGGVGGEAELVCPVSLSERAMLSVSALGAEDIRLEVRRVGEDMVETVGSIDSSAPDASGLDRERFNGLLGEGAHQIVLAPLTGTFQPGEVSISLTLSEPEFLQFGEDPQRKQLDGSSFAAFVLTVAEPTTLMLEISNFGQDLDMRLRRGGDEVATATNGGTEPDRIEIPAAPGDYLLEVYAAGSAPNAGFDLTARMGEGAQRQALAFGAEILERLNAGDQAIHSLVIPEGEGGRATLRLTPVNADIDVELYRNGELVDSSEEAETNVDEIFFRYAPGETFLARVKGLGEASDYYLSLSPQ